MDLARWLIVCSVLVCMIFTLGLLHKYARSNTLALSNTNAKSFWSAKTKTHENETSEVSNPFASNGQGQDIIVSPLPDFCFKTSNPEEIDKSYKEVSVRIQESQSKQGETKIETNK